MEGDDRAGLRAVAGVALAEEAAGRRRPSFTVSEGRRFGLAVGGAFIAFGGLLLWRAHGVAAAIVAALGAGLLFGGLAIPARLGPIYRLWMGLALAISRVTTPVLLSLIYFLLITPIGYLRRAIGGDPLRHPPTEGGGYWADRGERPKGDLERQF